MKLQKQIAYKYKDKEIYKHVIVVPKDLVEDLNWQDVEELRGESNGRSLVLTPKDRRERVEKKG